jgi:hypothetical protein
MNSADDVFVRIANSAFIDPSIEVRDRRVDVIWLARITTASVMEEVQTGNPRKEGA